jgi:phthalate 4,5-cis-dihydrodiol dehydrogenase
MSMELRFLRVGIIGLGDHGTEKILPSLAQTPFVKIVSTCDIVTSRAELAAQSYGDIHHYEDYRNMIDDENLDAVVVAVGPQIHYEAARFAINRGVAVFVEKPPTISAQQLNELVKSSDDTNVPTGVGLNFRYAAPIQMIKQILENDENGDYPVWTFVKHVSSKPRGETAWPSISLERSFLLMQVIHALDTLVFFNGRVSEFSSVSYTDMNGILVSSSFRFDNKTIGHLVAGSTAPNFNNLLEMQTRDGKHFRIDHLWDLYYSNLKRPINLVDSKRWEYFWRPSPTDSGYKRTGYVTELQEFFRCIINHQKFSPSFKDVLHLYELIDDLEIDLLNQQR